jgi:hypothetical protein
MGANIDKDENYNVPYVVPWFDGLNTQKLNLGREGSKLKTSNLAPDSGYSQSLKDVSEHSTSYTAWQIRTLLENFGINITYLYATLEVLGFMVLPKFLNNDQLNAVDMLGVFLNVSVFGNKIAYQNGMIRLYVFLYLLLSTAAYAVYLSPPDTVEHVFR